MHPSSITQTAGRPWLRRFLIVAGLACSLLATIPARASVPAALQGRYHIVLITVAKNGGPPQNIPLSNGAQHATFPVTRTGFHFTSHLGIFKQEGLLWSYRVVVARDTYAEAVINGRVVFPGGTVVFTRGLLTAHLTAQDGGTLRYRAAIRGTIRANGHVRSGSLVVVVVLRKDP